MSTRIALCGARRQTDGRSYKMLTVLDEYTRQALSNDTETAKQVGERHGKPVVLKVDAGRMHSNGFEFFRADNGVWLCDAVPPIYLGF